jgi:CBS domain-containing protein
MVLGDRFVETVRHGDVECRGTPIVVEACSDIAVLDMAELASENTGRYEREWDAWDALRATIEPVPFCVAEFEEGKPFRVHIRSHMGKWIDAVATLHRAGHHVVSIKAERQVEGGTSGGPVVNDAGELIGVVSNFSIGDDCTGMVYRPHLSLPGWFLREISR